jgi:hypothetical protein
MRYIDKTPYKVQGNQLVDDYLSETKDAEGHYINIDYSTFKSAYRKPFTKLLLKAQHRYCCYCMRKLNSKEAVTFEHIIPQSEGPVGIDYYREAPGLSEAEVILTSEFIRTSNQRTPPYPHTVAYNNLVVSCNGSFTDGTRALCCNLKRRDDKVFPLYLLPDAENHITYTPNGRAISISDQQERGGMLIDNTGLNCQILVEIRRLWYLLRHENFLEICACSHREGKRKYILCRNLFNSDADTKRDLDILKKFSLQNYWDKLMKYHYFYNYYNRLPANR